MSTCTYPMTTGKYSPSKPCGKECEGAYCTQHAGTMKAKATARAKRIAKQDEARAKLREDIKVSDTLAALGFKSAHTDGYGRIVLSIDDAHSIINHFIHGGK
jgi:hypothetical protein